MKRIVAGNIGSMEFNETEIKNKDGELEKRTVCNGTIFASDGIKKDGKYGSGVPINFSAWDDKALQLKEKYGVGKEDRAAGKITVLQAIASERDGSYEKDGKTISKMDVVLLKIDETNSLVAQNDMLMTQVINGEKERLIPELTKNEKKNMDITPEELAKIQKERMEDKKPVKKAEKERD
ncbi:MAG: hypothetical protein ACRCUS_06465 [Anaerovoracaceae bacterium]